MESSNKKIERKNKRKQHTLERETGCICSEIPTEVQIFLDFKLTILFNKFTYLIHSIIHNIP